MRPRESVPARNKRTAERWAMPSTLHVSRSGRAIVPSRRLRSRARSAIGGASVTCSTNLGLPYMLLSASRGERSNTTSKASRSRARLATDGARATLSTIVLGVRSAWRSSRGNQAHGRSSSDLRADQGPIARQRPGEAGGVAGRRWRRLTWPEAFRCPRTSWPLQRGAALAMFCTRCTGACHDDGETKAG
jgi:hypothetical protein